MSNDTFVEFCDYSNIDLYDAYLEFCDQSSLARNEPNYYYIPVENNERELKEFTKDIKEATEGISGCEFKVRPVVYTEKEVDAIIKHSVANKNHKNQAHHKLKGIFKWAHPFREHVKETTQILLINEMLLDCGLEKYFKVIKPPLGEEFEYVVFRKPEDYLKDGLDEFVSIQWNGNEEDLKAMHRDMMDSDQWVDKRLFFSLRRVRKPVGKVLHGRLLYLEALDELINKLKHQYRRFLLPLLQGGRIANFIKDC